MKLNIRFSLYVSAALCLSHISSCASKNENDESLEATEPTEAAPQAAIDSAAKQPEASGAAATSSTPSGDLLSSDPTSASAAATPGANASTATMPASGRRVMYVKVSGAALRETPDPKGKVAAILDKGDHMLVTIEGEWARTDDGKFVSMKVLSDKGVGRGKKDATWSAGKPVSRGEAATSARSQLPKKLPKQTVNKAANDGKMIDAKDTKDGASPSAADTPAADTNQQQ
jgi:hypothetical protein